MVKVFGYELSMELVILLLLILGLVCFIAAAFGAVFRLNLVALGLAFWIITVLIDRLGAR